MKLLCRLGSIFCLIFATLTYFNGELATGFMLAALALALALLALSDREPLQEAVLRLLTWFRS